MKEYVTVNLSRLDYSGSNPEHTLSFLENYILKGELFMHKVKTVTQNLSKTFTKNSPAILTIVGAAGVITTSVMAVRATPKALLLIEEDKLNRTNAQRQLPVESLSNFDIMKLVWPCYMPSLVMGTLTISCIVSANSINLKRNAALASVYSIADASFKEYQAKVVETIGEKKEQVVKDEIAKDRITANPVGFNNVIVTGNGNVLCYDAFSGRYFQSDVENIRQIQNEMNSRLLDATWMSLNDLYYELGLDNITMGDELGWDIDQGMISMNFSSQLTADNTPCLVMAFDIIPKYERYK